MTRMKLHRIRHELRQQLARSVTVTNVTVQLHALTLIPVTPSTKHYYPGIVVLGHNHKSTVELSAKQASSHQRHPTDAAPSTGLDCTSVPTLNSWLTGRMTNPERTCVIMRRVPIWPYSSNMQASPLAIDMINVLHTILRAKRLNQLNPIAYWPPRLFFGDTLWRMCWCCYFCCWCDWRCDGYTEE